MKPWALIILLFSLPFSAMAQGQSNNTVEAWVLSIFPPQVMRSKLMPLFDEMKAETGTSINMELSRNADQLLQRCNEGKPELVIASQTIAKKVIKQCQYRLLSSTYQEVYLFAKKANPETTMATVKKLGVLAQVKSAEIARSEMAAINNTFDIVSYPHALQMVMENSQDGIDAIIMSPEVLKTVPIFAKKWRVIHRFKAKGQAMILASPLLDKTRAENIAAYLLRNTAIAKSSVQKGIGLGPFVAPAKP